MLDVVPENLKSSSLTQTYSVGFHPRNMEMLMPQLIKLAGDDFGRMHLTGRNNIGDLEIMMSDMKNVYCYDVKPSTCFAVYGSISNTVAQLDS